VEGQFANDSIRNGHIKILYANQEYYEGNFENGRRNGKGTYYYVNGDIYVGDWLHDNRIGKGKL
jgi:hypothetical protein